MGLRAPVEGSDVTTSGSVRVFSACSIAATRSRRGDRGSIGLEKTRRAWSPQRSQATDSGAVPSGNLTTNDTPSLSHRYSYVVTRTSFAALREMPSAPRGGPAHVDASAPRVGPRTRSVERAQFAERGTCMPCLTWWGLALDGAMSKSNIALGIYTVAHEFGMSTTPENRPSIGAEPRIM